MMTAHLGPVPWGMGAGSPALLLDFTGPLPSPELARRAIQAANHGRPGMTIAWIRSAPWGDENFASVLDVALAEFPSIFATQDIRAQSWGYREVKWFVDCSNLMRGPTSADAIGAEVAKLPGFPAPAELLVRNPARENITPGLLEMISMSCGGPSTFCELAVPDDLRLHALAMAARTGSGWHVRAIGPAFPELKLCEVPT